MEFIRRAERPGQTLALLPGAWNPPTLAHLELAKSALAHADETVLVIPKAFPHKDFDGPPPEVRARWLAELSRCHPAFSAAVTNGGLFVEMAREAARAGAGRVFIACGADAAERITSWPYEPGMEIERQLESDYELLVAPRLTAWRPPPQLLARVRILDMDPALEEISSTRVREFIRSGGSWRHLVPDSLAEAITRAYG
jgi:nicotinic acid mononucleotide adenylyltransferase